MLTYLFTVYNKGKDINYLSQFSQPNVGKSNWAAWTVMPAFTYSHRYLQFLTDRLVNLPQYQQQLHWSIGTEITN
jgi:hypothetical protein